MMLRGESQFDNFDVIFVSNCFFLFGTASLRRPPNGSVAG